MREWVSQGEWGDDPDSTTWFAVARLDAGPGAPRGYVVSIGGYPWCGTGGCPTLVVARDSVPGSAAPATYRLLGDIRGTMTPIGALPTSSHGWPDLAITYCHMETRYRWIARFNGRTYENLDDVDGAPHPRTVGQILLRNSDRLLPLFPQTPPLHSP